MLCVEYFNKTSWTGLGKYEEILLIFDQFSNIYHIFFLLQMKAIVIKFRKFHNRVATNLENLEKVSNFQKILGKSGNFVTSNEQKAMKVLMVHSSQYWVFFSQYTFVLNKHNYICFQLQVCVNMFDLFVTTTY